MDIAFFQGLPWHLIQLPIIGALIGWLTNLIAIKMLFHPREEKRVLGMRIQGVFPKRQKVLAKKLGEIVARELFSVEEVTSRLEAKVSSPHTLKLVGDRIEDILLKKLPNVIPMVGMFLNQEMIRMVRETFEEDLSVFLKEFSTHLGDEAKRDIQVEAIVEEKVSNFSSDKLELLLLEIMKKEFVFIEIIGAVLGFLIGVAQVFLVV